MYLTEAQRAKLDDELVARLEAADGGERIRAIVSLGKDREPRAAVAAGSSLDPRRFSSRRDYRAALIEKQKSAVRESIGSTLDELRQLELDLLGGTTTQTVVVEGPASVLAASLDLSGVRHAELDREVACLIADELT